MCYVSQCLTIDATRYDGFRSDANSKNMNGTLLVNVSTTMHTSDERQGSTSGVMTKAHRLDGAGGKAATIHLAVRWEQRRLLM